MSEQEGILERYFAGEMDSGALSAFQNKLESDPILRRLADEKILEAGKMDWLGPDEPLPISHEMLEAYVEGSATDVERELVEGAMEVDPQIAAQVRELYALRAETLAIPAEALAPADTEAKVRRRRGLANPWGLLGLLAAGAAAIAAVSLLLFTDGSEDPNEPVAGKGPAPNVPIEPVKPPTTRIVENKSPTKTKNGEGGEGFVNLEHIRKPALNSASFVSEAVP